MHISEVQCIHVCTSRFEQTINFWICIFDEVQGKKSGDAVQLYFNLSQHFFYHKDTPLICMLHTITCRNIYIYLIFCNKLFNAFSKIVFIQKHVLRFQYERTTLKNQNKYHKYHIGAPGDEVKEVKLHMNKCRIYKYYHIRILQPLPWATSLHFLYKSHRNVFQVYFNHDSSC